MKNCVQKSFKFHARKLLRVNTALTYTIYESPIRRFIALELPSLHLSFLVCGWRQREASPTGWPRPTTGQTIAPEYRKFKTELADELATIHIVLGRLHCSIPILCRLIRYTRIIRE